MINVLVADDHPLFRKGVKQILVRREKTKHMTHRMRRELNFGNVKCVS